MKQVIVFAECNGVSNRAFSAHVQQLMKPKTETFPLTGRKGVSSMHHVTL